MITRRFTLNCLKLPFRSQLINLKNKHFKKLTYRGPYIVIKLRMKESVFSLKVKRVQLSIYPTSALFH